MEWVPREHKRLAAFVAQNGGETRAGSVTKKCQFRRVRELWVQDMGMRTSKVEFLREVEMDGEVDHQEPKVMDDSDNATPAPSRCSRS